MKRVSKVTWLMIGRASCGWTTEVQGAVETHTQDTWRRDAVACGCHRWLLVSLVLAVVEWRRKVREMRAIPGPFNLDERETAK
jgi:hypothetical protein